MSCSTDDEPDMPQIKDNDSLKIKVYYPDATLAEDVLIYLSKRYDLNTFKQYPNITRHTDENGIAVFPIESIKDSVLFSDFGILTAWTIIEGTVYTNYFRGPSIIPFDDDIIDTISVTLNASLASGLALPKQWNLVAYQIDSMNVAIPDCFKSKFVRFEFDESYNLDLFMENGLDTCSGPNDTWAFFLDQNTYLIANGQILNNQKTITGSANNYFNYEDIVLDSVKYNSLLIEINSSDTLSILAEISDLRIEEVYFVTYKFTPVF